MGNLPHYLKMYLKSCIPSAVTILRFLAAPLFFYTFIDGQFSVSSLIMLFAAGTDILDGYLARKMDVTSSIGAYLDVTADFVLVFASFLAMTSTGWYPYWVLGLISLIFFLFIATSSSKKLIYDPVGKYLGSYLIGMVLLSVIIPKIFLRQILLFLLFLLVIVSVISRILYLTGRIEV